MSPKRAGNAWFQNDVCLKKFAGRKILITIELTLLLIFIIKFAFNFLSLPNKSQISCDEFINMGQSAMGEPIGEQKSTRVCV